MIAQIYQSFLSNEYNVQSMAFFVKSASIIMQNVKGDFSLGSEDGVS